MKTKTTVISIVIIAVFVGGAIMLFGNNKKSNIAGGGGSRPQEANNVSIVDGKQVIAINAKGGYFPRITTAKAGLPTIIKIYTKGTFDCSSALRIPMLGYRSNLPPTGETLIDVPAQKEGTTMRGLCVMGMYNFSINFN